VYRPARWIVTRRHRRRRRRRHIVIAISYLDHSAHIGGQMECQHRLLFGFSIQHDLNDCIREDTDEKMIVLFSCSCSTRRSVAATTDRRIVEQTCHSLDWRKKRLEAYLRFGRESWHAKVRQQPWRQTICDSRNRAFHISQTNDDNKCQQQQQQQRRRT
jgi:hypothetical protein